MSIPDSFLSGQPAELLQRARRQGVYFMLPRADAELFWASCLADGFNELGIPVFSNINAYPLDEPGRPWLFPHSPMPPGAAAILIGDISDIEKSTQECIRIGGFVASQPQANALLCMSDCVNEIDFPPQARVVLTAHAVARVDRPGRRFPWAFGLNRVVLRKIAAARKRAEGSPRRAVFVRDFRPSFNQSVRQALDLAFVPKLEKRIAVDRTLDEGGRFVDAHYARLAGSFGCLAYGGQFFEDLSRNPYLREHGHSHRWVVGDDPVILRWDSWRFWEALAAGCLTVTLDFEAYGLMLPETPKSGVHYIGLRLDDLEAAAAMFDSTHDQLADIAERGQQWALDHYAPLPTALRFLRLVSEAR